MLRLHLRFQLIRQLMHAALLQRDLTPSPSGGAGQEADKPCTSALRRLSAGGPQDGGPAG
jgi:hypothetical protein